MTIQILLTLGATADAKFCGDCHMRLGGVCAAFEDRVTWGVDQGHPVALRLAACVLNSSAHTNDIRAAKLEALRDVGVCDDMTGDRVAKAIEELEAPDGNV
jgi:hypothetical protein